MTAWMIRAGRGGAYAGEWLAAGKIGIGWDFGGADLSAMSRDEMKRAYAAANGEASAAKVGSAVGQAYRFSHDMAEGSTVVMYDPSTRLYHVGEVAGPCVAASGDAEGSTYERRVRWGREVPRDRLSAASRNSLGSIMTIFAVGADVMAEMEGAAGLGAGPTGADAGDVAADDAGAAEEARYATYDDGVERIKDRVLSLSWDEMEQLVAGLLRSMGYHARVTPAGPDGGRDVVASPDALGLESPRIVAEVKHRKGAMGAPAIRAFIGGLRAGDRGLYVSTGGFTREARYEADRANVPVRLLDLDGFVRLYVESYERADEDARALLPLVRIWWPA